MSGWKSCVWFPVQFYGYAKTTIEWSKICATRQRNEVLMATAYSLRIELTTKKDHLARLQLADLYLDTRIYNGHTTTLDALWAGVPTITLQGRHFASLVSSSNLHNLGLDELITTNLDSYRNLAVKLAHNPHQLAQIRRQLVNNKMTQPLFNTENTTRNLEAAYQKMWHRHMNSCGSAPIHITL